MSLSPTLTWEQYQQLPPDQRRRPLTPDEYAALTRQQRAAAGLEDDDAGAPADFNGPVFPNPQHIQPQLDTDPTIPVTRLPAGASFQRQNFSGTPQMDISNPAAADVMPTMGREVAAKTDGQPLNLPPGATLESSPNDTAMKLPPGATLETPPAHKDEPGILDREIPLDSTLHAWESGAQSIGRGLRDAAKGTYQTIAAPPKDSTEKNVMLLGPIALPLYRTLRGIGHTAEDATQIVGAIHDINNSADPTGSYLKAAQETAGQGAGQALLALGTEGAARVLPKVPAAASGAAKGVGKAARVTADVVRDVATPENIATAAGGAVGGAIGHAVGAPLEAGTGGAIVGRTIGKAIAKRLASSASEAAPAADVARASDDLEGVTSPQTASAGEVNEVEPPAATATPAATPAAAPPATAEAAAAAPAAPAASKAPLTDLQNQIEKALGGKPLARGIPLKNQVPLPEGFTATPDSSLLKGYKYDPAAQEFSAVLKNGESYTHGQVSPEQVDAFEKADSQGSAWTKQIKQGPGTVLVKKNGLPVKPVASRTVVMDPETGAPEFSDVVAAKAKPATAPKAAKPAAAAPAAAADEGDLISKIQKSVEAAPAAKAAKNAGSTITVPGQGEVPRFVYRARDVGEQGVPAASHAQAGSDFNRIMKYAEPGQRSENWGQVVRIDLSKLEPKDFVVRAHPDGSHWVQFKRPLTEDEVTPFAGQNASTK